MHIYYLDAYLSTSFRDISTTMSGPTEVKTLLEIINSAALDALAEYDNRGERLPGINEIMLAGTSPHEADLSIKLKKMLRTLEGACGQLCATLAPPLHTIVNIATTKFENELSRTHFCAGDFFKDSPPRELDIYYLRNIVHNWPDKEAISILRTIKTCLKPESRILILDDYVIPSIMDVGSKEPIDQAPTPMLPDFGCGSMRVHNQDLTMLFMYNSRERTVDEVKLLG
ncbi:hypothetical protein D9757_015213 [Collybiopsis confluens]|uniref:O-methyltransferase C-terminal domain-containing protein n=1 Tax=Collybiopsis confluens TaxID=2823264 RepID=A0A8H5CLC2_9AGAR|nr:hypothetical protein D9757_015213 [Collybiopsis confluens]